MEEDYELAPYFAYYEDESDGFGIQEYLICVAHDEKEAISKLLAERFPDYEVHHKENLKAKKINMAVENVEPGITPKLSDDEREYLADKTFWDWKRAEIDAHLARHEGTEKAKEFWNSEEKFYHELYDKLKGEKYE